MGKPKTSVTDTKLVIRKDLQKYWEVLDEGLGALKCKIEGCRVKSTGEPAVQRYSKTHGWWNFERHLITAHGIKSQNEDVDKGSIEKHLKVPFKTKAKSETQYKRDDPRQLAFELDLLDHISIDGATLDVASKSGFIKLVRNRDPNLRVPSRRTLGRRLKQHAEKVKTELKAQLKRIPQSCLHISLDLWTTKLNQSVLGVRAHFVDDNWNLQHVTIAFKHFRHTKTGHNLRQFVKDLLSSLEIQPNQIGVIMADNASENIKAFSEEEFRYDTSQLYDDESSESEDSIHEISDNENDADVSIDEEIFSTLPDDDGEDIETIVEEVNYWADTALQRLGCTAHGLNLTLKDSVNRNSRATEILNIISRLVMFFRHSSFWATKLKERTGASLVKPGTTRWNSNVHALQRIMKGNFLEGLNSVLVKAKTKSRSDNASKNIPDAIPPSLALEMREMAAILDAFVETTNKLQADSVISSLVIGGVICAYKGIAKAEVQSDSMIDFRTTVCVAIAERFGSPTQFDYAGRGAKKQLLKVFEKKEYVLASILDPRIRMNPFNIRLHEPYSLEKFVCSHTKALSILEEALTEVATKTQHDETEENVIEAVPDAAKTSEEQMGLFGELFGGSQVGSMISNTSLTVKQEMQVYLDEKNLPESSDPLLYWRRHSSDLPLLSTLARRYLAFPATSGGVERLFSISGSIARSRRSRISVKTMENLLLYRESRIPRRK